MRYRPGPAPPILALFLLSFLITIPASSRASARPPVLLDTVRVEAPRISRAEELLRAPGFASVLDMDARAPLHSGLPGLLEEAPGVHVMGAGGPGAFATLSVRGSQANQVAILLDGVPIRWNEFGTVNLNDLPFESLARVEVYRGWVPAGFGGSAMGAVNLISDTASAAHGRAEVGAGDCGERQESAAFAVRPGGWNARATVSHEATRGDFSFLDDLGTWFNSSDDVVARRQNNDSGRWRQAATLTRGPVGLGAYAFQAEQGMPGLGENQARLARYSATGLVSHAWWRGAAAGAGLLVDGAYTRGTQRFQDPAGEFKLGYLDSRSTVQSLGGTVTATAPLSPATELAASAAQRVEHWTPEFLVPARTAPGGNRAAGSGSLEARLRRPGLLAHAGSGLEWNVDRGAGLTRAGKPGAPLPGSLDARLLPRAGASAALLSGLWVKADAAAYQRLPTLAERFGIEGSQVGNDTLHSEHGTSFDLGASASARPAGASLELEAARFWSRVRDAIVQDINSQRTTIPENTGRADISGVETGATASKGRLRLHAAATWLHAVDASDVAAHRGKQLPRLPGFEFHAEARFTRRLYSAALQVQHLADDWLDLANTVRVDSRTVWALELTAPLVFPALLARLDIDNLTNREVSDLNGYPLPGRAARLGLSWNFSPAPRASEQDGPR